MGESWAERFRPKRLADVLGNPQAVETLRKWGQAWNTGRPTHKAVLLHGPPGAGKTTAALALATELGWGLVELNASDVRSGPMIKRVAGEGALHETFSDTGEYFQSRAGRRKLILLDEADNLYERGGEEATVAGESFSDRGGRRAILDTIAQTRQPIILIANDAYQLTKGSGSAFSKAVLQVPFRGLAAPTLQKLLRSAADAAGVRVEEPVLKDLAARAHGDARSALNDLQALAEGGTEVTARPLSGLGDRNRPETLFNALAKVFKGQDGAAAVTALRDVDEEPGFLLAWLDENVPREYRDPGDLAEAYEWLSRADVLLGRVRRRQQFGLWGAATELMAYGVSSAKRRPYGTPPYYQFPTWIRKMSSSKGERELQRTSASKVAAGLHMGFRASRAEMVPLLRTLGARDAEFAEATALKFGFDEDEIRYVLGPDAEARHVDLVVDHVASRRAKAAPQTEVLPEEPEKEQEPETPSRASGKTLMDF